MKMAEKVWKVQEGGGERVGEGIGGEEEREGVAAAVSRRKKNTGIVCYFSGILERKTKYR